MTSLFLAIIPINILLHVNRYSLALVHYLFLGANLHRGQLLDTFFVIPETLGDLLIESVHQILQRTGESLREIISFTILHVVLFTLHRFWFIIVVYFIGVSFHFDHFTLYVVDVVQTYIVAIYRFLRIVGCREAIVRLFDLRERCFELELGHPATRFSHDRTSNRVISRVTTELLLDKSRCYRRCLYGVAVYCRSSQYGGRVARLFDRSTLVVVLSAEVYNHIFFLFLSCIINSCIPFFTNLTCNTNIKKADL